MSGFNITPIDASVVALVILLTESIKKYISNRFVPLIPIVFSLIFVALAVLSQWDGEIVVITFISRVLLETVKVSTLAMSSYKVFKTTIRGK